MYLDKLSFSSPLEHILLVFAFPGFGQERRRHRLPDWLFFPDELLNTTVERDQGRREEEEEKKQGLRGERRRGACRAPGRAKTKSLMVEGWETHQRKKAGFRRQEEKAACIEGREKCGVKG